MPSTKNKEVTHYPEAPSGSYELFKKACELSMGNVVYLPNGTSFWIQSEWKSHIPIPSALQLQMDLHKDRVYTHITTTILEEDKLWGFSSYKNYWSDKPYKLDNKESPSIDEVIDLIKDTPERYFLYRNVKSSFYYRGPGLFPVSDPEVSLSYKIIEKSLTPIWRLSELILRG